MSEIDELILASRALAHAASQVISLEEVPSRIVHEFYQAVLAQQEAAKARADSALDRASIPAMSDCTCNSAFGVDRCPFHGYAKGVSVAPEPKMQRALAEGQFNVVGDELLKINQSLRRVETWIAKPNQLLSALFDIDERQQRIEGELIVKDGLLSYRQAIKGQLARLEDRIDRQQTDVALCLHHVVAIESQLTALRAEADKGREHPNLGVHLQHCNFGENVDVCKYGEDDCPALTESWSWFGKALEHKGIVKINVGRKKKQERKRGRK